jgi:PAS domain S-box-containing protein
MVDRFKQDKKPTKNRFFGEKFNEDSREHFFEDAPIAIYELDLSSLKMKWMNKQVSRLLGYTENELLTINIPDLLAYSSKEVFRRNIAKAIQSKKTYFNTEVQVKTKKGRILWGLFSSKVLSVNGEPSSVLVFAQDITETKKMEEELREREQLYRTLFENTDDGFILAEPIFGDSGLTDFRFLKINDAYERQTGAKASNVLGKRVKEAIPKLEEEFITHAEQVVKTGKAVRFEKYNELTKRWYDAYYFPYAKRQVGVLFRDITQRKKTEQELAEKQKELSRILDSSPTIIFYKDKMGKIIEVNRALAESLKTSKEKLVGKTVFDLYSPEIAQQMTNDDLTVMETKQPKLGIIECYESPTGLRWIRTDKIPSLDENGAVTGIVGFSEDVTERKKAQEALIESEAKYEQLVNRLPEMVFEIDTKGKIVFANSRATEILGYSKEEFENNFDANRLVAPEDVERSKRNMKILFSGKIRNSNEYIFMKKDGERFLVLLNSVPIIKENKVIGARGLVIDITERKNMEKKMKENERIMTIGQIAGMVGHDIRNPLQAIAGELYLAKQDMAKAPDNDHTKEATESLSFIQTQLDYINKIVSDLQDYARPLQPDITETELTGLIHQILETISFPENITLLVETNGCLQCRTDQMFIRRALTNLVNNAIQAMPDGGDLKIGTHKKESKITITIADTGRGIPEEVKAKLFTPMVTTKAKGQGLGLAVVKRLIEALNGSITFESQEGKGTKFTIQLPLEIGSRYN